MSLIAQIAFEPASNPTHENETMERTITGVVPRTGAFGLSMILVRTTYESRRHDDRRSPAKWAVERTAVAQVVADQNRCREYVCDVRRAGSYTARRIHWPTLHLVKKSEKLFCDDGTITLAYDCRQKAGVIRPRPASAAGNRLASLAYPVAATGAVRYFSRTPASCLERLRHSRVRTERTRGNRIVLEGTYHDSDSPARFEMVVAPDLGYAVVEWDEYDAQGAVLSRMRCEGFTALERGSVTLWLPRVTIVERHVYDAYEGHRVQTTKLNVLLPELVDANGLPSCARPPSDIAWLYDQRSHARLDRTALRRLASSEMQADPAVRVDADHLFADARRACQSNDGGAPIRRLGPAAHRDDGTLVDETTRLAAWNILLSQGLQLPQSDLHGGTILLGLTLAVVVPLSVLMCVRRSRRHFLRRPAAALRTKGGGDDMRV